MTENIIKHNFEITKKEYENKNGHKAGVLWLTGLSGSGKSTIANLALKNLFNNYQIVILYLI